MRYTLDKTTAIISASDSPSQSFQNEMAPPLRVRGLRTNPDDAALEAAVIGIGSGNRDA